MMPLRAFSIAAALLALPHALRAQHGHEWASQDSFWQLRLTPAVEAVLWSGDAPLAGLLDAPDTTFLSPALELSLDAQAGSQLFFHTTARWDRGFDGGNEPDGEVRIDELFLRYRVFDDQRLNLQIGKFPTVFGAWVAQHDFFDDPFLLAPLPYSQVIGIQSRSAAAVSPAAIAGRAAGKAPAFASLSKQNWASVIWGPSYASGAAVFGSIGQWDYAAEVKNAALSSHSDAWNPDGDFLSRPTFSGRLGFRPDAAWALGVSASHGPYLSEEADATLPPGGMGLGDLDQSTLGLDVRWAHHDWILSGELIGSQFETAAAGDLRTLAWYLQARWKVAPGFWLAVRGGQQLADSASAPDGDPVAWTPDVWRAEIAAGWRILPNVLLKAGYAFTHTSGEFPGGEHLFGLGIGWQF